VTGPPPPLMAHSSSRYSSAAAPSLWHGLLTVPPGLTEGLHEPREAGDGSRETCGRRTWHGQEAVPQRVPPPLMAHCPSYYSSAVASAGRRASQTRTFLSQPPLTRRVPSRLKATPRTTLACPLRTRISCPDVVSHRRTVPSSPPAATRA